jgi:hypothetical protein
VARSKAEAKLLLGSPGAHVSGSFPKAKPLAFKLSRLENQAQPFLDGFANPPSHGLAQRPGGEFQCSSLPLKQPRVTIGVENPITKQIMEHSMPRGPLGVIIEPGLQYVLYVFGVARDGHEALLLGQERNRTDAGLVRATTRAEVVTDPVMQAITVLNQAR